MAMDWAWKRMRRTFDRGGTSAEATQNKDFMWVYADVPISTCHRYGPQIEALLERGFQQGKLMSEVKFERSTP